MPSSRRMATAAMRSAGNLRVNASRSTRRIRGRRLKAPRVPQAVAGDLAGREPAPCEGGGEGKAEGVLGLLGRGRGTGVEADGSVESLDLDRLDAVGIDAAGPQERQRGLDCGLGPAANRERFEVELEDAPAPAEVGPQPSLV